MDVEESKQETVDEYAIELDRTYSGLLEKLLLPTGYRVYMLTVQCLNLLLQKQVSHRNEDRPHFSILLYTRRLTFHHYDIFLYTATHNFPMAHRQYSRCNRNNLLSARTDNKNNRVDEQQTRFYLHRPLQDLQQHAHFTQTQARGALPPYPTRSPRTSTMPFQPLPFLAQQ